MKTTVWQVESYRNRKWVWIHKLDSRKAAVDQVKFYRGLSKLVKFRLVRVDTKTQTTETVEEV